MQLENSNLEVLALEELRMLIPLTAEQQLRGRE